MIAHGDYLLWYDNGMNAGLKPIFILLGVVQVILLTLVYFFFVHWSESKRGEEREPTSAVSGEAPSLPECRRAGCSGEICTERPDEAVSTCEFRPEYACYAEATCERQPDGTCGFTRTEALEQCLMQPQAIMPSGDTRADVPPGVEPW